mgnify:FL=1|nr:outer membrane beta-barrel family protein [uncultured Porphyromonas sp.]
MKRILILLFIACSCVLYSYSQTVSGRVIDTTTNEAIPFATISIHRTDSTVIDGVIGNEQGLFSLNVDSRCDDVLWLRVSSIGYKTYYDKLDSLFVIVKLNPDTQFLDEVVVRAKHPAVKINSSGSIESLVSGTPLENYTDIGKLLQALPGIINMGGAIKTLNGSSPIFYINNRKVLSMSEISSLDVKTIKKIEVNNNPGIEFGSEVGAIIRITTIRPNQGLSLSLSSAIEKSRVWSHSENLSGSYSINNLTLYGSANYDGFQKKSIQDIQFRMSNNAFEVDNHLISYPSNTQMINYSFGVDFIPSLTHTLNIAWDGYKTHLSETGMSSSKVLEGSNKKIEFDSKTTLTDISNYNHIVAFYKFVNDNKVTLSVTGDYAVSNANRNQITKEELDNLESQLENDNGSHNQLASLMADVTTPINEKITLQIGGQYDYLQNRNVLSNNTHSTMEEKRDSQSKENIFALYAGMMFHLGKFSGNIGLRYEKGNYLFQAKERREDFSSNQLLPYFSVAFPIKNTSHSLSYRYSTIRPSLGLLGNYSYYLNRYNIQEGNPSLRPQLTHSFDYSLIWRSLYFSANYQYIHDPILPLSQVVWNEDHRTVRSSWYNLKKQHNLTLLLNYNTVVGWYRPSLTLAYMFNVNYLELEPQKEECLFRPLPFVSLQNTFSFPSIDIKFNYQFTGKGYSRIFLIQPQHILNLSLQKTFFENRLTFTFYWNDILRQAVDKYSTSYQGLIFTQNEDQDRSRFGVKINYRLKTTKKQQIQSTEQLQRL